MRRSALAVAVTALFLPAVAASIADAEPMTPDGWTAPVGLGVPGHINQYPVLSMGAGGDVTAAVLDYTDHRLVAQSHAAGGTWSSPVALSAAGKQVLGDYQIVTSPTDDSAIAIWAEYEESGMPPTSTPYRVYASSHEAGGNWSAPVALSPDGLYATSARVALGTDGRAIATWYQSDDHTLQYATRTADGTWSAPAAFASTDTEYVDESQLVLRPDGSAVAVWHQDSGMKSAVLHGSTWSSITDLGAGGSITLASNGQGDVAFTNVAVPTEGQFVRTLGADDTWSPKEKLSDDGALNYYQAALDLAPDGSAIAAWTQADGGIYQMHAARRDATGHWSPAETLGKSVSDPGGAAAGINGLSAVGFQSGDSGVPFMAALAGGGAFGPAATISGGPGGRVRMGGDGRGSAAAVYMDTVDNIVGVTFQDRSGPDLRGVSIPHEVTAGEAVSSFSVSPVDAFSGVAQTVWDFGDGTGAVTGEHPSHTYGQPGTYTVSVSAKDTLGWTTTRQRSITVDAETPVGGGPGGDGGGNTGGDGGGDSGGPTKVTKPSTPVTTTPAPSAPAPSAEDARPRGPLYAAPTVMLAHRQKLATILSRRAIRTTVVAPAAGSVKVTATVSKAAAKKLGLKSTRLAFKTIKAKADRKLPIALSIPTGVVKRAAKLKTLTVTLTVTFTAADGHVTTTKTTLSTRA